jgi:hypothetical protein
MSEIDPETMREFKEAMQEALPFFKGLGKAAGDVVDGLMKLTNWITGKLNLLNGDNTSKEAVSQHYGTTSAPAQPGSNPVANAYGASQPKSDGTHEPNMFDTFHDWWNGTSDAKDVSSYAQSTNGDYSPVSMLKQSAAAPAKPASAPIMQPVVLQNQLPEGLIHLTISPDPTFGNMLNATVDQRINDNNQRMVLAVSSGQGAGLMPLFVRNKMATPGSLTIGGDSSRINSTQNSNNSSATRTKGENGFTILASVYNPASDNYIRNYQAIVFDAVTDTGVRRQADITSYPVESGAEVSDHVQIKNNTFKMSGVITETPIRLEGDLLYSAGVNGTRISQAITYLDQIFDSRQPITLVTEHKVYENVILSGISYDYKSEFAMQFDLEFEQIQPCQQSYG